MFRYFAGRSSDSSSNDSAHYGSNCCTNWSCDHCPKDTTFGSASHSTQSSSCGRTNGQTCDVIPKVVRTIRIIISLVRVEYIDDGCRMFDVVHDHEDFSFADGIVN